MIVVTQGNSDMFIRATPMERREMVEEMLGLREYQIKRMDAVRRLKSSRDNLVKVSALIEEILPHLRSLRRQTSRWEKRGALVDELTSLEREYYGSQLSEVSRESLKLDGELNSLQMREAGLQAAKETALEELAAVEAREPQGRQELKDIKSRVQEVYAKKSDLQRELARIEVRIEALEEKEAAPHLPSHGELMSLVSRIKQELERLSNPETKDHHLTAKQLLNEIESLFNGGRKKEASPEREEMKSRFQHLAGELAQLEKELSQLQNKERDLEAGQEQFTSAFKVAVGNVDTAKRAIESWEHEYRHMQLSRERVSMRETELLRQLEQAGLSTVGVAGATGTYQPGELQEMERRMYRIRGELASMGEVDEALIKEAAETETRYEFLASQATDLEKAIADLKNLVRELKEKIRVEFTEALSRINEEFAKYFALMFDGGHAKMKTVVRERKEKNGEDENGAPVENTEDEEEEQEEPEEGVEITLSLPRKRLASLEVLSGGEKSLVGLAALFAMISVSPPPFLVLDEIDAPLDEKNARRYSAMLKEFARHTQFVVVTHNRVTMEAADVLYGVTLDADGSSKVVSLKLT
jgi:chromosome segregation protein